MAKIKRLFKDILQGLIIITTVVLIVMLLRVFLFASFRIPSSSMEPTLLVGDHILVNKLIPGPRIFRNFDFLKGAKVETYRINGRRSVERNDILVFNFPYSDPDRIKMDLNVFYIKRCVAIPGDSFLIDNGIFKVKSAPDTLGVYKNQLQLSEMENSLFSKETFHCFPESKGDLNWTIKNFGPLYVPGINDQIKIDSMSILLYKNLIEYETDKKITTKKGIIYLDGKEINHYIFKQNYYFMAGDLVFDSKDSRYWGLLPEDHIIGKAAYIWQSRKPDNSGYRWNRFFHPIQ